MLTVKRNTNEMNDINMKQLTGAVYTILLVLLTVMGNIRGAENVNQKFTVEPENLSANAGTKVTLPCRVIGKHGLLQWTKDDFGLGTDRNLTGFERYSMIGIEEDGDHNLRIDNVTLEDDAKYQCQVSPGPQGN